MSPASGAAAQGKSKTERFNDYLRFGSFPYAAQLPRRDADAVPYLEGIYHTILLKDVAKREGINDISVLESIVKTLASSVGSPIWSIRGFGTSCLPVEALTWDISLRMSCFWSFSGAGIK